MVVLNIKTKPIIFIFLLAFFIFCLFYEKFIVDDNDNESNTVYKEIIIEKVTNIEYCENGFLKSNIIKPIDKNVNSFDQVENNLKENNIQLEIGGHYFTIDNNDCYSDINLVLIVPYFNDTFQSNLIIFLNHMHLFLSKQKINYGIYLIQSLNKNIMFNKGYLMNIGFIESTKDLFHENGFNCFVFHDLNILPKSRKILYKCENEAPIQFILERNFGQVI